MRVKGISIAGCAEMKNRERVRERNLESIFPLLSAVLVLPWQHGQVSPSSQGKCNCCLFLKARVNIQHLTLSWLLNTSKSHTYALKYNLNGYPQLMVVFFNH